MKQFNVIMWDFNKKIFTPYDVLPYLMKCCKKSKFNGSIDELKQLIKDESMYMFWSRCEYEIILSDWPPSGKSEKWDVYKQIMMNIDIIADIIMNELKINQKWKN